MLAPGPTDRWPQAEESGRTPVRAPPRDVDVDDVAPGMVVLEDVCTTEGVSSKVEGLRSLTR